MTGTALLQTGGSILLQIDPTALPMLLLLAGLVLSIAEALIPGAHFIVVGIALIGAGLAGLLLGPLASPLVLAVFVLVFGGVAFYGYSELGPHETGGRAQTRDSTSLKGQTGRVTERITPTAGEVKLEEGGFNPYYAARSMEGDIPEGTEVMVVDPGGGSVLTVEPVEAVTDAIDRELARERERSTETGQSGESEHTTDRSTETERE